MYRIILLVLCALAVSAQEAVFFAASGRSMAQALPVEWQGAAQGRWRCALPGAGSSTPIPWQDRIYVTCYTGYGTEGGAEQMADLRYQLLCIDADTGAIRWQRAQQPLADVAAYAGWVKDHGYASATPAVDADAIYTCFETTGVQAWSHDGDELWRAEIGTGTHKWGASGSPVLAGDLVIVNADVEGDAVIALDRRTGREVWRLPNIDKSWATPAVVGNQVVVSEKGLIRGVEVASGGVRWQSQGIGDYICPTPTIANGVVYAIGGRQGESLAVATTGSGTVEPIWRNTDVGSNVSSAVYHNGYVFWAHTKRGQVYCVDAASGQLLGEQSMESEGGRPEVYAIPLIADGKLYIVTREKGTYVLSADPELRQLARNVIPDDDTQFDASPMAIDGDLLLRSDRFLYRIRR